MLPKQLSKRTGLLAAVVLAAATVVASLALAEGFDTSVPSTIVVGSAQGHAASDRLDPARRGQAHTPLPRAPRELWRRELAGGLELPPLVDANGAVVAALVSPDVVRLAADGRQLWRTRLGAAPAVVAPVLTSNGSTALVCSDGTLWSVSAGGAVRFSIDLMMRTKKARAAPLARDDGSLIVAGENEIVQVGPGGAIRSRAQLPSRPIGGVIPWRRGVLVTGRDGVVHFWQPPAALRKLGELGGQLEGGGTLASDRTVVGVIERRNVVALDLLNGSTTLLLGGAGSMRQFEAPVTLNTKGVLLVSTFAGELFGIDAHGMLVRRVALEPQATMFGIDAGVPLPSMFRRVETRPSPPLVVDSSGQVAFVRNSGKVGVLDTSDNQLTANPRLCARPIGLLPAGTGRMIVACRSGSLALYGDK